MAGRLRKPPVMGGFFQRRENEVEIDNKINLGFSGGGFRATFYCLGARIHHPGRTGKTPAAQALLPDFRTPRMEERR